MRPLHSSRRGLARPAALAVALAMALATVACSETSRRLTPEVTPAAPVAARLEIRPDGADGVLVSAVALPTDTARVGSFTAILRYDAAQFTFAREAHPTDGALRAIRTEPGLVQVAGAAAGGFPDGTLLTLAFRASPGASSRHFVLDVKELVRVSGVDATRQVTVGESRLLGGVRP